MNADSLVDTFIFWEFYKVEIFRNVWNFYIKITHLPTGFSREREMDIAQDYILPLVGNMNEFIKTHDMDEYMKLINEIRSDVK